jgi:hypothetical protein
MTGNTWKMAALRPAAVAIHNNGDVLGQTGGVDLREQVSFVALLRFQK